VRLHYICQDSSIDLEEIRRELGDDSFKDLKTYFGQITNVYESYAVVDDVYYLSHQIIPKLNSLNRNAKIGDSVCIKLGRKNKNEDYQVLEFEHIWRRTWGEAEEEEDEDLDIYADDLVMDENTVKETGKVVEVAGGRMEVLIRHNVKSLNVANVWRRNFLPYRGDLVMLTCLHEGDDNDFGGCKILRAVPLRYKDGDGLIENWMRTRGKIAGDVFLDLSVCGYRYAPRENELIRYHAVECEPSLSNFHCIWRATSVAPKKARTYFGAVSKPISKDKVAERTELLMNKRGIEIDGETENLALNIGDSANLNLIVYNRNDIDCVIDQIRFPGQMRGTLGENANIEQGNKFSWYGSEVVPANGSASIRIEIVGLNIGRQDQIVVFAFKDFCIGRMLSVDVSSEALAGMGGDNYRNRGNTGFNAIIRVETKGNFVVRGVKRKKDQPPSYINNKLDPYPIPKFMYEKAELPTYSTEIVTIYPALLDKLSPQNYESKLKPLLYIEEVAAEMELNQYSLQQVAMTRVGPYLCLAVPGLKERRPSLVLGDSVLLSHPLDPEVVSFDGAIMEVRHTDILLQFDENFQRVYCGEVYDVAFRMSRSQYRRQHHSLEMAVDNLGFSILFPNSVVMKSPQVDFVVEKEKTEIKSAKQTEKAVASNPYLSTVAAPNSSMRRKKRIQLDQKMPKISEGKEEDSVWVTPIIRNGKLENVDQTRLQNISRNSKYAFLLNPWRGLPAYTPRSEAGQQPPTLTWINRNLNAEQKSAVTRVLTGEGRPAPYIIYGPPGTGKTVTVVEAVLQIFLLHPNARIMVAAPSNSAADLVTERIVQTGRAGKGELVRLNAYQRTEESIPEPIRDFCLKNDEDENLLQASRHRILVSTSGSIGSLCKLKMKHGHFTHVFVDEAGHMTEPECLIPLGLLHRETGQIVLAGDPQQLGPVLQSPLANVYGLEISFLERLSWMPAYLPDRERFKDHGGYDPVLVTKLVQNYRSHPDILTVPSQLFYDAELVPCAPSAKINKYIDINFLPSPGHPVVFHGVKGDNRQEADSPSWFNPQEVWQVVVYTQKLLAKGVDRKDIGIISPYRKQSAKIREMFLTFQIKGVKVGSVEEFQGQERPVIIISTTRSCSEHQETDNRQGIGFLASPKERYCSHSYGLHGICDDVVHLQHEPIIYGLQAVAGFLLDKSLKN